jgi:small-conductance mechanosensitive channel
MMLECINVTNNTLILAQSATFDVSPSTLLASEGTLIKALISSGVLLIGVLVARWLAIRAIRRHGLAQETRRRWLVHTRNGALLIFALGLIIIWGSELRALAVTLVAIAAAIVIATKELIMCVSGSLLKAGAKSFAIGDRIQVKETRGDVIDQTLLSTTIMEVGPGKLTHQRTGRGVVLPNSMFVSEPVTNESYTDDYVLHVFSVPMKREEPWQAARRELTEAARRQCAPHLEEARRHMQRLSEQQGLDTPSVEPRVTIQYPTAGEVHLIVRVPTPVRARGQIEQAILQDYFEQFDATTGADNAPPIASSADGSVNSGN